MLKPEEFNNLLSLAKDNSEKTAWDVVKDNVKLDDLRKSRSGRNRY